MVFKVEKASDYRYKSTVEINTLEDLLSFVTQNGDIVLKTPDRYSSPNEDLITIIIYDSYLE